MERNVLATALFRCLQPVGIFSCKLHDVSQARYVEEQLDMIVMRLNPANFSDKICMTNHNNASMFSIFSVCSQWRLFQVDTYLSPKKWVMSLPENSFPPTACGVCVEKTIEIVLSPILLSHPADQAQSSACAKFKSARDIASTSGS